MIFARCRILFFIIGVLCAMSRFPGKMFSGELPKHELLWLQFRHQLFRAALAAAVDPLAPVQTTLGLLRRHALAVALHAAAPAAVEVTHAHLAASGFAERHALAVALRSALSAGERAGAQVLAFSGVKCGCRNQQ